MLVAKTLHPLGPHRQLRRRVKLLTPLEPPQLFQADSANRKVKEDHIDPSIVPVHGETRQSMPPALRVELRRNVLMDGPAGNPLAVH